MRDADRALKPRFSYAVAALDRSIRRSLGAVLQPLGLSVAEYTALSLVRRRDGYSNAQLARRSFVSPQAMHEMIQSLEGRGLLERAESASHRSIRHINLTESGRALLEACDDVVDVMEAAMLAGTPDEQRDEIVSLLMDCAMRVPDLAATE
jgi:DNA-binding MarR family transcriptional regulator